MKTYHLTETDIEEMLNSDGAVVQIGQIAPAIVRKLDKAAKEGRLVKYRGYWNTMSPWFGMGPLKSIWALPERAPTSFPA